MSDILTKALEEQDYLMHHGILGQKWGVRRYQNPDGSMTDEGKRRYSKDGNRPREKINAVNKTRRDVKEKYNKVYNNLVDIEEPEDRLKIIGKLKKYKNLSEDELRKRVEEYDLWDEDYYPAVIVPDYIKENYPKLHDEYVKIRNENI